MLVKKFWWKKFGGKIFFVRKLVQKVSLRREVQSQKTGFKSVNSSDASGYIQYIDTDFLNP